MPAPLRIDHLELALDPESPYHLCIAPAQADACTQVVAALRAALASPDLDLAARAVVLCGHLTHRGTLGVLVEAASSPHAAVREAAAAALHRRADDPPELLATLLLDRDSRVRTRALAALADRPLRRRLRHLAALKMLRADPDPRVRQMAQGVRMLRRRRRAVPLPAQRTM